MVRRSARGWLLGYEVLELGRSVLVPTEVVRELHRHASALPVLRGESALLAALETARRPPGCAPAWWPTSPCWPPACTSVAPGSPGRPRPGA